MIINGPMHVVNLAYADDGFGNQVFTPTDMFFHNFERMKNRFEE